MNNIRWVNRHKHTSSTYTCQTAQDRQSFLTAESNLYGRLEESDRISYLRTYNGVPHQQHSCLPIFSSHLPEDERIGLHLIRLGAAAPCSRSPSLSAAKATFSGSSICCPADIFSSMMLNSTGRGHNIIIKGVGTGPITNQSNNIGLLSRYKKSRRPRKSWYRQHKVYRTSYRHRSQGFC